MNEGCTCNGKIKYFYLKYSRCATACEVGLRTSRNCSTSIFLNPHPAEPWDHVPPAQGRPQDSGGHVQFANFRPKTCKFYKLK